MLDSNLDLLGLTQEHEDITLTEADNGEALMATFEAVELEANINNLIVTQEQLDSQVEVAEQIVAMSSKSGLSGDTVEALTLAVEALSASSLIMPEGYLTVEGESFDKVKNFIKSMIKSVQIFFQKFVQMVGKWVTKLGTFLAASDKTREKLLEDIGGWEDKSLIAQAPSTWFESNSFNAAIHSFKGDEITKSNFQTVGDDRKLSGLGSSTIKEILTVTMLRHGTAGAVVIDNKDNIKTVYNTLKTSAKNAMKPTTTEDGGKKVKGVAFSELKAYISTNNFKQTLERTGKEARELIDDQAKAIKEANDDFKSEIKDTDDRETAINLKAKALAVAKLDYKGIGATVSIWKDAITIAKVIASAIKKAEKGGSKLTEAEKTELEGLIKSEANGALSDDDEKRIAELKAKQ